jgi:hypothetical protein
MRLTRRGLVLGCAAAGLSACAAADQRPGPLATAVAPPPAPLPSAPPPAPAPLVVAVPATVQPALDPQGLIRPALLSGALAALRRHGDRVAVRDRIYLVDFQQHSSRARLFRLDLNSGQVTAFRTAHGRGSDPAHTGFAQTFSNRPASNASSLGAYVTLGQGWGAKHGPNVTLDGLDPSNSEVRERAIIVHAADYCEPGYLASCGKLGRSNGCLAVSQADLHILRADMDAGRLIFAAA